MENKLIPEPLLIDDFRELLRVAKDGMEDTSVHIELSLWNFDSTCSRKIKETIGVYYANGGATRYFHNFEEAFEYAKQLRKEEENEIIRRKTRKQKTGV